MIDLNILAKNIKEPVLTKGADGSLRFITKDGEILIFKHVEDFDIFIASGVKSLMNNVMGWHCGIAITHNPDDVTEIGVSGYFRSK